jgi:ferrous iron transport protein A
MNSQTTSLANLPIRTNARIIEIQGGHGIQQKLEVMGIRIGKRITLISKQPFRGPLTIKVCNTLMTIGRGMAQRIIVEVVS